MIEGAVAVAALAVLIWVFLIVARGGFWRADQCLGAAEEMKNWPDIVAVIPARNEVATIASTVTSLQIQNYPGNFKIVVVDDNSTDDTKGAITAANDTSVLDGKPLKPGWTGKLWAVSQGLEFAKKASPNAEYVLLTDADITHDPGNLRDLVYKAVSEDLHLVSLMVKLRCVTFWERLLIPAFVFFFQKLYPFTWVNDPENRIAAAAGGCMLVRLDTLRQAGGIETIKEQLIDDCALAALIKSRGLIWLGLANRTISTRAYSGLSEIWQMVARTAFVQLDHSFLKLLGTIIAMMVIYLVPPVSVFAGMLIPDVRMLFLGGIGWGMMCLAYFPVLKLYNRSIFASLLLPVAGFLYTLMTISSAICFWRGRGGLWKGRSYPE